MIPDIWSEPRTSRISLVLAIELMELFRRIRTVPHFFVASSYNDTVDIKHPSDVRWIADRDHGG